MPNPVTRWLAARFGSKWPAVVKTADGAVTSFLVAFGGKLIASGLDVPHLTQASVWQAAALAGAAAALSVVKSGLMILITGQPALGGLVSSNLRNTRTVPPVTHKVPVRPRKPAAAPRKRPVKKSTAPRRVPDQPDRGAHEAPE